MEERYCSRVHLATLDRVRATHQVFPKSPNHWDMSSPTYCCTGCIPHIRFETKDAMTFRVLRPRKATLLGTATFQHNPKPIAVVGGVGGAGGVGGIGNVIVGGGGGGGGVLVNGDIKVHGGDIMVYREGGGWVRASVPPKERIVQVELSPLKTCDGQAISRMVNSILHRENQLSPVDVHCKEIAVSRSCYEHLLTDGMSGHVQTALASNEPPQLQIMGYPVREDTTLSNHVILIALV